MTEIATPVPSGFRTVPTTGTDVLVPEGFDGWDPADQRGYLAQRCVYAAEGQTIGFAYDCVVQARDRGGHHDPWDVAASVLGVSMSVTRHAAWRLVETAVELTERLPLTRALLSSGWIGLAAAHVIGEETRVVSDELMPALDRMIAERLAPTRRRLHPPRPGPLRKMLLRAVALCDPVGAHARAREARRDVDVRMEPLRDDLAVINATVPADTAVEIMERVEALARTARPDDPRTIGRLRAAGLLALSRGWSSLPPPEGGHPDGDGGLGEESAARRVVLHLYPEEGGLSLAGYGPLTGFTADLLAESAEPRTTPLDALADPDSAAARRYAPTAELRRFCEERDGTCVFPGCQVGARSCDLDHIVPFDHDQPGRGGRTTSDDLACLCRFHHRLKTDGVWAYYRVTDGSYAWIHGPRHPGGGSDPVAIVHPCGPLARFSPPRDPGSSPRQRAAARAGLTGGRAPDGCAPARGPLRAERRRAERDRRRAWAERERGTGRPSGSAGTERPDDDEPPF